MDQKTAVIIGAGPAGLTAAYELLTRTDIHPIIFEATEMAGGIARTFNHNGNRIDLGGHRFFSKSARVTKWWLSKFPLQKIDDDAKEPVKVILGDAMIGADAVDLQSELNPEKTDKVMLVRKRLSRILFRRRFFDYPVTLNFTTLRNLGFISVMKIGFSYLRAKFFPIRHEQSLEDFFINRFGRELYKTFFKNYTEKVWGVPCTQIKPDWGAQRIKGLSVAKVLVHAVTTMALASFGRHQKKVETSLVDYYLYPKYGPGQLWDSIGEWIEHHGGEIHYRHPVMGLEHDPSKVATVKIKDEQTGEIIAVHADYVFSTMPVRDLILGMGGAVPADVRAIAENLQYRDFMTIGLLFPKLKTPDGTLPDNWIYIQEGYVKVGRIQVFNNWSPYLVQDSNNVWLGLEYFCQEGDTLWTMNDDELIRLGVKELEAMNLIDPNSLLDGVVLRMPKAYPAYFGGYERFDLIRSYVDQFENLFLIGRNGMHRYNNMDHSMLAAMTAVDNILAGVKTKTNLWHVNTETEYHEGK
ncbi:MAG TPA: NAD(P)/FAD-dependent oxidoreductase [Bacteroidota bacterium]|nr:NAD(P)/FAD-dependent oxidoreductase [Bacteroidota bacterium]